MSLVVKSKIKEACKGIRCSKDFFDALDKKVGDMLKIATERAKENNRKTLRPADL